MFQRVVSQGSGRLWSLDLLQPHSLPNMKPLEFYNWAAAMTSSATSEPLQRTIVGRLYYGLHHEACCRFYRENPNAVPLQRYSRHASLLRFLNQPTNARATKVANLLWQLRNLRTQADYDLGQMYVGGRPASPAQVLSSATQVAALLPEALDSYSPGEAPDGCICRVS